MQLAVAPDELDPDGRLLRVVARGVIPEVALQEVELAVVAGLGIGWGLAGFFPARR